MIDLRLLLCGLIAWGVVGLTVTGCMADHSRAVVTSTVGVLLMAAGLVVVLGLRRPKVWWGGVICIVAGAAEVSASLQVAAWTDPDVERILRNDVVISGGVHGTVERIDTSDGPAWAPAVRWRVLVGARVIEGPAGTVHVDLPVILETTNPVIATALPPPGAQIEVRGVAQLTPGSTRAIGIMRIDTAPVLTGAPGWIDRVTNCMRNALLTAVGEVRPAAGGIIASLAIGDESRLPEQTRIDMREAGLAHLIAVSGPIATYIGGWSQEIDMRRLAASIHLKHQPPQHPYTRPKDPHLPQHTDAKIKVPKATTDPMVRVTNGSHGYLARMTGVLPRHPHVSRYFIPGEIPVTAETRSRGTCHMSGRFALRQCANRRVSGTLASWKLHAQRQNTQVGGVKNPNFPSQQHQTPT